MKEHSGLTLFLKYFTRIVPQVSLCFPHIILSRADSLASFTFHLLSNVCFDCCAHAAWTEFLQRVSGLITQGHKLEVEGSQLILPPDFI